jgi:hypothetical protein
MIHATTPDIDDIRANRILKSGSLSGRTSQDLARDDIHSLVRVTANYRLVCQRSIARWQHPDNSDPSLSVMGLGLKRIPACTESLGLIQSAYRSPARVDGDREHANSERKSACGSKESDSPFPFPPRGKPGRGWFPPRRVMFRASRQRWHGPCGGSPRKRASPPCAIPRLPSSILPPSLVSQPLGRTRRKTADGRHVGLDFL